MGAPSSFSAAAEDRAHLEFADLANPEGGSGGAAAADGCWRRGVFEDCCDVVRWGPGGRGHCWDEGGGFEQCCVRAVLGDCPLACGDGARALLAGVSPAMCADGWEVRACDLGVRPPEVALYSQWSPSYFMSVAWMLRSLRLARDPVRVVLRRVWDTRNVSTGDQFSWGPTGYHRQRAVRAQWFESVVRVNWHRMAVTSDTDVEYFPGWLDVARRCLDAGADVCAGQQPGWDRQRRDGLNPGFLALRGNERTLGLFEGMPKLSDRDERKGSELFYFNHYLNLHPIAEGGPRWAAFHPEVVLTGTKGMEIRIFRTRVHHAATGKVPHRNKELAITRVRKSHLHLRKFCISAGAGRFPVHPICIPTWDFPMGLGKATEEFRLGQYFAVPDLQRIILEYNGAMARWKDDPEFQLLYEDAVKATGLRLPRRLCDGDSCWTKVQ